MGTSSLVIDDEFTDDSDEQMITKTTQVMNVNIMPNILATWKGTNWLNTMFLWSMLLIPIMMKIIRSLMRLKMPAKMDVKGELDDSIEKLNALKLDQKKEKFRMKILRSMLIR